MEQIRSVEDSKPPRARLAGFIVAVVIGGVAVAWINTSVRQRMKDLEKDLGTIQTERFYQAVHVRQRLRGLNERLVEYQVSGERLPLVRFRAEADEMGAWIAGRLAETTDPGERALYQQLSEAFGRYLEGSGTLQERKGIFTTAGRRMEDTNQKVEVISAPVLQVCEDLAENQSGAFEAFLGDSQRTLDSLQGSIQLSLLVLLALAVSVAVLVYRGMIAPLQVRLSESQAIIARQEKLAALGGLAAGVAHEIRNPLTAIKFRLFSLKKSLPAELRNNEDAEVIAGEISRLERIVRDFLEFARPSEPEIAGVSSGQLLDEVSRLMRPQLAESGIELLTVDQEGLWLQIDFQQIKQVLINLIRNAAESIDGNGTITLRAYVGAAPIAGTRTAVSVVEVADTGRGMSAEVSRRLFDPFFTTKEGGSGLGLSIAARIVEKHDGELQFETRINQGTTFKLLLPTLVDDESTNSTDRR